MPVVISKQDILELVQSDVPVAGAQLQVDSAVDYAVVAQHERVQSADAVAAAGNVQHVARLRVPHTTDELLDGMSSKLTPTWGCAPVAVWPM